jgi:hypothetical protein
VGKTTSERVSPESHGNNVAHDGGHAQGEEHITVGSSDDSTIFILPNAQVRSRLPQLGPLTHDSVPAHVTGSPCHDEVPNPATWSWSPRLGPDSLP